VEVRKDHHTLTHTYDTWSRNLSGSLGERGVSSVTTFPSHLHFFFFFKKQIIISKYIYIFFFYSLYYINHFFFFYKKKNSLLNKTFSLLHFHTNSFTLYHINHFLPLLKKFYLNNLYETREIIKILTMYNKCTTPKAN
jgi:hypothetical protein